ncbi:MAG: BatD family protein [Bacteroidales bacterium]|nr:BatD family protein [Bacteroidales bacterium]
MKRTIISALLAAAAAISALAQTRIDVQAPNMVEEGKAFNVVFVVEGEHSPSDFRWSAPEGIDVQWGPQKGTSTSVSIVNGHTSKSSKTTMTYVLVASRTGTFQMGKATAKVSGNTISSKNFMIEVVASGASTSSSSGGHAQQGGGGSSAQSSPAKEVFITLSLSKKSVVVGEPVTATLKLYRTVDIAGFEDVSFPKFNGFWSQEVVAPTNIDFHQEQVSGHVYDAALLRQWVLIPQKAGDLAIDPAELVCLVSQVTRRAPTGTIFDQFNDTQYVTVRRKLSTSAQTIHVSALPAGAPASFSGGVGKFSIKASVSKDSLRTHDAASIMVTVSGKGNVSLLEAPALTLPPDFEAYDVKSSSDTDRSGTSGSRTFEYPFIPRSSGHFVLPPVQYSYFDPDSRKYVTVSTDSLRIDVARTQGVSQTGQGSSGGTLTVDRQGVKNLGEDIRFIRPRTTLDEPRPFFMGSAPYWAIAAVLLAISAALYFAFRKVALMRADVEGSRKRKATGMALRRLREAGDFLKKDLYTAFYESLHRSLLGFVSDKLSMDMASQTKENIEHALTERGVKADVASRFTALLDACEFARYAPNAGHEAMDSHYHEALDTITLIDSSMKKPAPKAAVSALALLLLLVPAMHLNAQPADSLWNKGVEAYTQGDYEAASASWNAIAESGMESVELYYNLGNACFKDGNLARAILWWERARKLDPSDKDVRHNLEFARLQTQDRIDSVPEFFLRTWLRKASFAMRSNVWAALSLVLFALALAMLLLFLLGSRTAIRRTGFFTAIAAFLLSLACLGFASVQKKDALRHDSAVVMLPVASVKSAPSEDSATSLFVLHEGTTVKIVDTVQGYTLVELSDGRQGWISTKAIEVI